MDPNPHTLFWSLGQEEKKGSWEGTPIMVSVGLQLTEESGVSVGAEPSAEGELQKVSWSTTEPENSCTVWYCLLAGAYLGHEKRALLPPGKDSKPHGAWKMSQTQGIRACTHTGKSCGDRQVPGGEKWDLVIQACSRALTPTSCSQLKDTQLKCILITIPCLQSPGQILHHRIFSYFQRPVKSGRAGIDHTEEDQPFFAQFWRDLLWESCGAMALCPLISTGEDFLTTFWYCGTLQWKAGENIS